ncbi:unnamed protein product, partial [Pylaiella littoralis]
PDWICLLLQRDRDARRAWQLLKAVQTSGWGGSASKPKPAKGQLQNPEKEAYVDSAAVAESKLELQEERAAQGLSTEPTPAFEVEEVDDWEVRRSSTISCTVPKLAKHTGIALSVSFDRLLPMRRNGIAIVSFRFIQHHAVMHRPCLPLVAVERSSVVEAEEVDKFGKCGDERLNTEEPFIVIVACFFHLGASFSFHAFLPGVKVPIPLASLLPPIT